MIEYLERGDLAPLLIHEVYLGERDHAMAHAEQLEDAQVFFTLRFPALGGGHHEQTRVDSAYPREHVAQETDVSGNVDEADAFSRGQHRVGEPEIDGETPPLLLGESIGIGAGEGEHQ